MTIKSKIFSSFSVLVALFVLNGVATILTLNENKRLARHTIEVLMPSSDALDSLTLVLMGSKMYSTNWVYLQNNNADKQSLITIENRQYSDLKQKLNFYRRQWDDPRWTDSLGHIIGGFEYLLAVDLRIMEMLKSFRDYDDPIAKRDAEHVVESEVLPISAALIQSLNGLNASIKLAIHVENDKLAQESTLLRTEIIVLAIIMVCAGLFFSIYMTRLIIEPIHKMRAIINDLGRGVIRPIDTFRSRDEIGSMVGSVNILSRSLRATAEFARDIGAKNFSAQFQPLSEMDTLGIALIAMRDNLRASEEELNAATLDLYKKDQTLEAVGSATHELVSNSDFDEAIGKAIRLLGEKTGVDAVNVYQVELDEATNQQYADQLVRWTNLAGDIQYHHKDFQHIGNLTEALDVLCTGEIYYKVASSIKDPVYKARLERRSVKSVVAIPIFAEKFWGFVSLNDCRDERTWTPSEFSVLKSFAASLGSAIQRMKMEQELVFARDKAEAASVAKSDFMANMSHELRTPMNAIIGFTDLVLTTEMEKMQREYLKNVRKGAYNLLNIINDILDFSKIEAGKLALEEAPFSLLQLLEDTVDMMSIKAEEKKLELICDADRNLPSAFLGDEPRIRQILINLLGNAIKFTEEGEISVVASYSKATADGAAEIEIAISDTGIGIPAEKLELIFESFTQADSSTTRKYGGTGLGLSISKRLSAMMGGHLRATSVVGKGSTFTLQLRLPVADEAPSITFADRPPLRSVLVVDDNHTNCHLMERIFGYLGIPCIISLNGNDALEKITQAIEKGQPFDLIITDHQMPVMDGITLVKKIKEVTHGKAEPIILMLSSLEKTVYQHEAERVGIDKFLSKPVKMHELEAILGKIFEHGELSQNEGKQSRQHGQLPDLSKAGSVLVVEDEPINMFLITEVLTRMGLDVIKAGNGREAIHKLAENPISLIFMDVNMPEVDGYSATRMIRNGSGLGSGIGNGNSNDIGNLEKRNVPIIALTADALPEDKEKCLNSGMNDYVAKPFKLEELQNVLQRYLNVQ